MKTDSTFNRWTNVIGKGVLFPITLTTNEDGTTGWYPKNASFDQIKHNITSLMWYMIGQRFRQEDFGTRLWECIEEPNTQALNYLIKEFLNDALSKWEGRITVDTIEMTRSSTKVAILVTYTLNNTNTSQYISIVYDKDTNTLTQ